MFGGTAVPLMQRSKLRAVWSELQQPIPGPLLQPAASGATPKSDPGWSEAFAPILDAAKVASLKKAFFSAYPSEILSASNTPSLRLLRTAVDAEVKKIWYRIPWKSCMSQQVYEDSQTKTRRPDGPGSRLFSFRTSYWTNRPRLTSKMLPWVSPWCAACWRFMLMHWPSRAPHTLHACRHTPQVPGPGFPKVPS